MIAVSIYCCLIKYKGKQKHLLPFYITNDKFKEVLYQTYTIKLERNFELKKVEIKIRIPYHFDDIMWVEDIDFDMLLDEKPYENILIHETSYKILRVQNHCVLGLTK